MLVHHKLTEAGLVVVIVWMNLSASMFKSHLGDVIVDHQVNVWDVQATSRNVSCDKHAEATVTE